MANLLTSFVKYFLLILFAYCTFSIFFSNRVNTQYFSVVLSDGWAVSKAVEEKDGTVSGAFYNKRTQTVVAVTIIPNGFEADLFNLSNSLMEFGSRLINPNLERSEFKNAQGYEYANYKDGEIKGIIFKTSNNYAQTMINIYGTSHGDGVDFVNTFFNTDTTLFPEFVDPSLPPNRFNYIMLLRQFKTWIHSQLNPTEWFN